jgi:two-component system, OmpR family, sensor histidine kinase KdpD
MERELAGIRAWAYVMGMPACLVAMATPVLFAVSSLLPPNLIWLCYLMPVVFASTRWGLASAATAAATAGLAGDFFFTHPYYSLYMEDRSEVAALLLFLIAAAGSALVITNLKQAKDSGPKSLPIVRTLLLELSACQTSGDVIVYFRRWISVVARGRAAFVYAQPVDTEPVMIPEEIQRIAIGMWGTTSDDVRTIAAAANKCWFLKKIRSDDIMKGTLAVEIEIDACDRKLVEVAITSAAIRFSELTYREKLAAAADYVSDPKFSHQWRTSLTTILGAASVVLMRCKLGANHLDRTLLTDIRDEAAHLSQLLTNAFPASCDRTRDAVLPGLERAG